MEKTVLSLRRAAAVLFLVSVICFVATPKVANASVPLDLVPICIDDICVTIPVLSGDYVVKLADFNADGMIDLFVTGHPTRRFVPDFLLLQTSPDSYSIVASPTALHKEIARTAPISEITVNRVELNADRFYDFYLRNVDEAIAGASDIIVTLTRGVGDIPAHVAPVTSQFAARIENFIGVLAGANAWIETSERVTCSASVGVTVPYSWGNVLSPSVNQPWLPYFSSVDGTSPALSGYTVTFQLAQQPPCFPGIKYIVPPYQNLVSALRGSTHSDVGGADVWTQEWCNGVFDHYNLTCESRYIYSNTAVVAGSLVVATAIIVAVLHETGDRSGDWVRDIVDAMRSAANEGWFGSMPIPPNATPQNQADAGPGTSAVPLTGIDKYAFQLNCNHGPSNVPPNRGAATAGSSKILRKGLGNAGCGCPSGSEAHHIIPKAGGASFPATLRNRLRSCLNNAGVDIDHPANGVCLPKKADPNSPAAGHSVTNGKTYWNSVADLCDQAYNDSGPQGVRNMLDQAREHLLNGNQWWKPGFDPFWPPP